MRVAWNRGLRKAKSPAFTELFHFAAAVGARGFEPPTPRPPEQYESEIVGESGEDEVAEGRENAQVIAELGNASPESSFGLPRRRPGGKR
ncbi:MAG TPA: hypothetical protein VF407_24660 [Polyangiaceae bacterium]